MVGGLGAFKELRGSRERRREGIDLTWRVSIRPKGCLVPHNCPILEPSLLPHTRQSWLSRNPPQHCTAHPPPPLCAVQGGAPTKHCALITKWQVGRWFLFLPRISERPNLVSLFRTKQTMAVHHHSSPNNGRTGVAASITPLFVHSQISASFVLHLIVLFFSVAHHKSFHF